MLYTEPRMREPRMRLGIVPMVVSHLLRTAHRIPSCLPHPGQIERGCPPRSVMATTPTAPCWSQCRRIFLRHFMTSQRIVTATSTVFLSYAASSTKLHSSRHGVVYGLSPILLKILLPIPPRVDFFSPPAKTANKLCHTTPGS